MKAIHVYRFGQLMSFTLWALVAWSLLSPERSFFQQIVLWVGLATIIVHVAEIAAFLILPRLKPHLSLKNTLLTMLFGGFHLKWLMREELRS